MSDFEVQIAALRAECDREIEADGEWADITVAASFLRRLLDALERKPKPQA